MVKIDSYTNEFEEEYWQAVNEKIDKKVQKRILKSCIKFLPRGFFEEKKVSFKHMVLAPYQKLKSAQESIEQYTRRTMEGECFLPKATDDDPKMTELYQTIYDAYENVAKSVRQGTSMRVRMVRKAGITVCPYCNRDYINCRAKTVSGAQLDHFFSRAEYPVFSVCLYNLVPVCGNCNRVKSNKIAEFISPFDEDMDWENIVIFSYDPNSENGSQIIIKDDTPLEENISQMRIREAYQIHDKEVGELLEKKEFYAKSQRKEFQDVLCDMELSDDDMKQVIFGPRITQKDMQTKPLGKMLHDLHKKLKIYTS